MKVSLPREQQQQMAKKVKKVNCYVQIEVLRELLFLFLLDFYLNLVGYFAATNSEEKKSDIWNKIGIRRKNENDCNLFEVE